MIAWATTDLPEPDSPTSATVLPCGTRKSTPRTACSGPVSRSKAMLQVAHRQQIAGSDRRNFRAQDFRAKHRALRHGWSIG